MTSGKGLKDHSLACLAGILQFDVMHVRLPSSLISSIDCKLWHDSRKCTYFSRDEALTVVVLRWLGHHCGSRLKLQSPGSAFHGEGTHGMRVWTARLLYGSLVRYLIYT